MLKNQAPYRLHEVKKYPFEKGKTIKTEKLSWRFLMKMTFLNEKHDECLKGIYSI